MCFFSQSQGLKKGSAVTGPPRNRDRSPEGRTMPQIAAEGKSRRQPHWHAPAVRFPFDRPAALGL